MLNMVSWKKLRPSPIRIPPPKVIDPNMKSLRNDFMNITSTRHSTQCKYGRQNQSFFPVHCLLLKGCPPDKPVGSMNGPPISGAVTNWSPGESHWGSATVPCVWAPDSGVPARDAREPLHKSSEFRQEKKIKRRSKRRFRFF